MFADGVLTPALTVVSAIEGISALAPIKPIQLLILPLACTLLLVLFLLQSFGTGLMGLSFAPLMVIWYLTIGISGLTQLVGNPIILKAINPARIFKYSNNIGTTSFLLCLGKSLLAISGCEAMYANLGNFKRNPIRASWITFCMPCLVFQYLGQAGALVNNPENDLHPFFYGIPSGARWPVLALSTLTSIIASQALISGCFMTAYQGIKLKIIPPLKFTYTSSKTSNHIYIPMINLFLMLSSLVVVLVFKDSTSISSLYGLSLSADMFITSCLFMMVLKFVWNLPPLVIVLYSISFGLIDLSLLAASFTKISNGGWVSITVASIVGFLMYSWRTNNQIVAAKINETTQNWMSFNKNLEENSRQEQGVGIFLSTWNESEGVPHPLDMLLRTGSLPSQIICVSIEIRTSCAILDLRKNGRMQVSCLENGVVIIHAVFGYREKIDVELLLERAIRQKMIAYNGGDVNYYSSRHMVLLGKGKEFIDVAFGLMWNTMETDVERLGLPAKTREITEYVVL